jgi:hypothetical protein
MVARHRVVGMIASLVLVLLVVACSSAGSPAGTAGPRQAAPSAAAASQPTQSGLQAGSDTPAGALIVRTGSLELEVGDVNASLPKARDLVASMGGYVAGSEESHSGDKQVATITYPIPVERWQDAVNGLRGLADTVVHESTQAEEVTAQVVDLDARLTNLRSSETSLREIMSRAGSITDVLAVQDKLTQVRDQIERLTAQQKDLTGRAALATLQVSWETPVAAVTEVRSGWDLGREFDRAAAQTVAAAQSFASFLVWLVVVGVPVFGPIILLIVVGVVLYRRWAAKRPARPERPRQTGWGPPGGGAGPSWAAPVQASAVPVPSGPAVAPRPSDPEAPAPG